MFRLKIQQDKEAREAELAEAKLKADAPLQLAQAQTMSAMANIFSRFAKTKEFEKMFDMEDDASG
jgi:hypothetical protein